MPPQQSDPRGHPWWKHMPSERRSQALWRRHTSRLVVLLGSRRGLLSLVLLLYLGIVLVIARSGAGALSLVVLFPLLLVPALAGLAWWLTWDEYHR